MTGDLFGNKVGDTKKEKKKCHLTHKVLKFGKGRLVGASCGYPRPGYDIYIGFDWGMEFNHDVYPWANDNDPVIEFQYRITDTCAPKKIGEFRKMIKWVCTQLDDGKKIHVGCIGGHGRTGLFIAAVRAVFDGDLDAGNWVRKNHCHKGIETKAQVNFLFKYFKIKKVKPSKTEYKGWVDKTGTTNKATKGQNVIPFQKGSVTLKYISGKGSIWG